ncbi:double-strand break repair helicase AddA [Roseovarius aestuariivivens]|uniref:double-strand break repair helicase AddA n=1 Tax=Roseovarius aestuariivivens TaxID=1888910 RepID=UPI001080FBC9|nr:double-strand break repair helicase AddA [Roseovarius aestuariivivens]
MRDDATQRQVDASSPGRSTWLSANAGSGKTKVLTDRVARLLLSGTDPQNILCLTFTKAAANEMQNRLFKRLGEWAMLPDSGLLKELEELGVEQALSPDLLAEARRLFAIAIETPGGLKIQTIHSFCSSLLRRFPLEAGVSPQFREMEERATALMRADVIEDIATRDHAQVLYDLAALVTDQDLSKISAEIVRHREAFAHPLSDEELSLMFGIAPDFNSEKLLSECVQGDEMDILASLLPHMRQGGTTDQNHAERLVRLDRIDLNAIPELESIFLYQSGQNPFSARIGKFPTQKVQKTVPDLMPRVEAWMRRIEDAREKRLALTARQNTRVLHAFARAFLSVYDRMKLTSGLLDFDDLILKARDLLTDRKVADWILFKLDGGIDHILVDEAQDTSPAQWQLIEKLSQEFTSGEGARSGIERTIFVVGDKKQSIYSFQGADPDGFDRMRKLFADRIEASGPPLQDMEMEFSFRSAQTILTLVDQTFGPYAQSGFTQKEAHKAFKSKMPGRVDLWPLVEKEQSPDLPPWDQPIDIRVPGNPASILANRVADAVTDMIAKSHLPDKSGQSGRRVRAGDILVLVQRRGPVFHEIIRACKTAGLPVAGADRLRVGAELAVRDLRALLAFLDTPEDDLSLATALRSPLFSWSEAQIFDLAHAREKRYLWAEMRRREADFQDTFSELQALRKAADFLRPYDMIERILTRHHGRHRLLSRLGPEAEDGIDALLSQAMTYEQQAVDSLTGFLVWMETDELEIKRQTDSAGDQIRVMTAHGAKGLESPIVILPDCAKRQFRQEQKLARTDDTVIWRATDKERPALQRRLDERQRDHEQAERDRLLYVAMTRAEQWLIVAAAGELSKEDRDWYGMVRAGMLELNATTCPFDGGEGLRLQDGNWDVSETILQQAQPKERVELPEYFNKNAKPARQANETLSPSDLGGSDALAGGQGLDEESAKRRGRQIHRLLEFLPQVPVALWTETADDLLSKGPDAATSQEVPLLLAEVEKVLNKPSLQKLFAADALAEVPVTADLPELGQRRIHGQIDRLLIAADRVLAVDFKTHATIPESVDDCPESILRQMGAYASALSRVYPDRRIETAVLWTRNAELMSLPHDLVMRALARAEVA